MLQFIFLFCFIICSFDVVIDFFVCCSSFFPFVASYVLSLFQ